jgi:CubicO group peptidase (beta-lactamase class C family)
VPGTTWYYNGGATVLLGEVIRRASGLGVEEFAAQHLFEPLGISDYRWFYINPELVFTAGNLRVRPRDMAKLGQLFLNGGTWEGERVVSQAWIDASTKAHSSTFWPADYGYQWWVHTYQSATASYDVFYADGWGGQRIIVFPASEMVVVFTGGNYNQPHPLDDLIQEHILPALEG